MNIGLDVMGGDFAPLEAVKGLQMYMKDPSSSPVNFVVFGNESEVKPLLDEYALQAPSVTLVPASQVIEMHEHPARALKSKPESSISLGFQALAAGKIDAFISAGNTGAMLVGAMLSLKPIEGVIRPTISTLLPKENGKTGVLLDVGLNADCKPEHLNQFATLGSLYAHHILGIEQPSVGLLNIGEEEGKGNVLAQATYTLLKENKHINFCGNVEGRDLYDDKADVIVCEGFTGNILLKMSESLYEIAQRQQLNNNFFNRFDFEAHGGTPILGINKPVIIGHGIAQGKAFKNKIALAVKILEAGLLDKMQVSFQ